MSAVWDLLIRPEVQAGSLALLHFLWEGALLGLAAAVLLRASTPESRYGTACGCLLAMAAAPVVTYALLKPGAMAAARAPMTIAAAPSGVVTGGIAAASVTLWLPWVFAAWLAGVALFAARAAGGWGWACWRTRVGRMPVSTPLQVRAGELARRLGLRRAVRLFESGCVAVPSVFGVLRPVILLPVSAVTGLPRGQLEAVLAHELAHIARRDPLLNALATVVEVLLFYHPAVWWLSRRIRQERELCCDAAAVQVCGDRVEYSRALLALEEARQGFALAATSGDLKARIERLLGAAPRGGRDALRAAFLPALLLVVCAAAAGAALLQPGAPDSPYQRWAQQDVVYIMRPEESWRWNSLTTDQEREHFIEQFWLVRDPTPGTLENEFKAEHYRRIRYANERFSTGRPGWTTSRGRIYIVAGPPDEIESQNLREVWRYSGGREYEFAGQRYDLVRQKEPPRSNRNAILERISVDALPEPVRSEIRARVAPFAGQRMSDELLSRLLAATSQVDKRLSYSWNIDRTTGNTALAISYDRDSTAPAGASADFPTSTFRRVRIGGNVMAAKLLHSPAPEYPAAARAARLQGVVRFTVLIGVDGSVSNLSVVSGHPLLVPATTDALRQWKYQPTTVNGEATEVVTTVDVNFVLP